MSKDEKENQSIPVFKRFAMLQRACKTVGYNDKAKVGKFSYDFVTLGKLRVEILDPLFEKYGFFFTQLPEVIEGQNCLRTVIFDLETGEPYLQSCIKLTPRTDNNPQDTGSSLTYSRRYSLFCILGIVADKDDDANLDDRTIEERIKDAKNIVELNKLFQSLRDEEKNEYKTKFTERKNELKEAQEKNKLDILENSKIE
ncbi:MAG: ERF family protein [Methanobrevibacter sp.]|nr:ERF family protein [Methanobrevibacter sp.]